MSETFDGYSDVNIVQSDNYLNDVSRFIQNGKVLLVTSPGFSLRGMVGDITKAIGVERVIAFDKVTPNPEKFFINANYQEFVGRGIANIVAIGGGSAIDTAKVFSAMLSYEEQSLELLLSRNDLQCQVNLIAIPSTSGTGAEVTPFATVWESETQSKHSLYGIRPTTAILDPKLTLTLPYTDTLYPALDALSHALESLWNKNRTEFSEGVATEAIELICDALPKVLQEPADIYSRQELQQAATLAGLAISTTKTALAHAISYPLTSRFSVPHGLACSFTLLAIIHELGYVALNLTENLTLKVTKLLETVDFSEELTEFVSWPEIQSLAKLNFDQSRTGNFIFTVDGSLVTNVLMLSQQLAEVER
ncbi:MAG: phosphonoacetaldehyde reductase [Paraglaciecola sp.]|uniref:phosphonoacetaldehyde reductase n=1 Tax=Paraglaciecola sp. TaxID=1920173 RepID=UPI00329918BA